MVYESSTFTVCFANVYPYIRQPKLELPHLPHAFRDIPVYPWGAIGQTSKEIFNIGSKMIFLYIFYGKLHIEYVCRLHGFSVCGHHCHQLRHQVLLRNRLYLQLQQWILLPFSETSQLEQIPHFQSVTCD